MIFPIPQTKKNENIGDSHLLTTLSISLPVSFAHSFRRNNVMRHKKKEKLLFYIKTERMCDGKLVFPYQK